MSASAPLPSASFRPRGQHALWGLTLALSVLVALATGLWRQQQGAERLDAAVAMRLEADAASLTQLFDKHQHLPRLLALEPRLLALLQAPADAAGADAANRHLAEVGTVTDVQAAYLMNRQGQVLAASNWDTPRSFMGQNYTFRPYFQQALAGGAGVFYAVGATTEEPGLFLSQPLRAQGQVMGVVVVKISLAPLEAGWARSGEAVALADEHGVIFLAADPAWRYRSLAPLDAASRQALADTRRYGRHAVQPLPPRPAGWHLSQQKLPRWGWTLLRFSDPAPVRRAATLEGGVAGLLAALLGAALGLWRLQRHRALERRSAARALRAAHEQLERRIAERTAELTAANQALEARVADLHAAERILQATQNQAVQAGKLAVLGQLAAGITHEINQPLSALATGASNALKQLARGRTDDLQDNLQLMLALTGRLGAIVGPLKGFARPADAPPQPVAVADALGMALMMLAPRLRAAGLHLDTRIEAGATQVMAERTRLEQVLVNLLRNAIDAMTLPAGVTAGEAAAGPRPDRLEFSAWPDGAGRVRLCVRDHGPGLSADVMAHLFEPFFSTRPRGEGLGLGLTISRAIALGLGGELSAANLPSAEGGGAAFTLTLPAVAPAAPELPAPTAPPETDPP